MNSSVCSECTDKYILKNNLCVLKNIPNCKDYQNNAATITCTKCDNYYYLLNNVCKRGSILNCLIYNSQNDCSECETSFQKILIKNNEHYCIPVTTHDNCIDLSDSQFQSGKVHCEKCKESFFLQSLTSSYKVCNQYHLIPFCETYDTSIVFTNATF